MKTSGLNHNEWSRHIGRSNVPGFWRQATGLMMAGLGLLAASFLALSAQAQTNLGMRPFQIRMEVPVGFNGTITNVIPLRIPTNGAYGATNYADPGNLDTTSWTNWLIAPANVSISGTPAGCTASLVDSGLVNPIGAIPINLRTNSGSTSTNLIVKLVFDGTQASGTTTLTIAATGAGLPEDDFFLPVEVAAIWNGSANAAANGAGSFTDPSQWLGGAPGQLTNVVFTDVGAQTNSLIGFGTSTTNFLTNCVITSSTVISSLRFAQTNGTGTPTTNYHNLYINDGVNLAIAGNDGFSILRDYTYWTPAIKVTIWGPNGTLIQTNENSNFSILTDGQSASPYSVLNMYNLGNLYLDVNQLQLGDCFAYPNYLNLRTNGFTSGSTLGSSMPNKMNFNWIMARTNFVKAVYADPNNYANPSLRNYSVMIGRADVTGGSSANDYTVNMGSNNTFYVDSICVGGYASLGSLLQFSNANSYALFRGTNGGRMSMFATADAAGTSYGNTSGANTKSVVDFTKGYVDMQVDRFYLSRDRSPRIDSGNGDSQTAFSMNSGIIDANTAILGFQNEGSQTNYSYCYATMVVSNTAIFKVNNTLALGYTTCAAGSANAGTANNPDYGQITIGPGGTVMASNITVGGVTKLSGGAAIGKENKITLLGNASLIVSNGIADATPNGALGYLTFSGANNSLTLFIDGSKATPYVYVTNLTVSSATGTRLIIGSVKNIGSYPADVLIMTGSSSTAPIQSSTFDAGVSMPAGSGLSGTLSTVTTGTGNQISLHIINRNPNTLVWRGPAGGSGTADWDYTTTNWVVLTGPNAGRLTNYDNPDVVAFDNAAGYATNINLAGSSTILPGAINMTNSTLYYTFQSGGNLISGGSPLNKYGGGTVKIDCAVGVVANINEGVLTNTGSGSIASANIASGAVMISRGNMSGTLACAGTATTYGTISGTLAVQNGGIVTNAGTVQSFPITVQSNGLLYNASSGMLYHIGVGSSSTPTVAAGGTLINGGTIENGDILGDNLYVKGIFEDLGGAANMTLLAVTIDAGGTFIPGGDGTGTTTIYNDGSGTTTVFDGTLAMIQGSTNIFKVHPGNAHTQVECAHLSFGGSSSQRNQNGCILLITNYGATAFSAGQTFHFFDNVELGPGHVPYNTGSSTNTYPVIIPATPGPGLSWDLSQLWANGSIGVITTPLVTLTSSETVQYIMGTNMLGTNMLVGQFSWDSTNTGWRLQNQVNPLSVGLSNNWTSVSGVWTTNWPGVAGTWTTNQWSITNKMSDNANSVIYYRLVFP